MTIYPDKDSVRWVSTDWLQSYLDEVQIVDTQPNAHDCLLEHIPGAVYFNEGLLRLPSRRPAVYGHEKIKANFKKVGLHHGKPVVYTGTGAFKGWGDGLEQTMVAYTLARFGHTQVYVLDGGLDRWKQEERPLTKEFPTIESDFAVTIRNFIEYEEFKIKDRDVMLDARPSHLYGRQGPWMKPGHIRGAVNVPWTWFMDDANTRLLKPEAEITALAESNRVTADKTILCSCGTGREATNEFLLIKWFLQYPSVKIYEGSFTEWSLYPDNPTGQGKIPDEVFS